MESGPFLIVGLGNPGLRYEGTRHNLGFKAVVELAEHLNVSFKRESSFKGSVARAKVEAPESVVDVHLLLPTTYMNLSGQSVKSVSSFFKIPTQNVLIVCDDAEIPFGALRLREKGGSGGHNGLKSVTEHLNSSSYPRLRMGIGKSKDKALDHHVLERFTPEEESQIPAICKRAIEILISWATFGIDKAQERLARQCQIEKG